MECGFLIQRWGYEGMAGTEEGRSHGAARPKPRALSWRFQESRTSCELERAVDREVVMMGGQGTEHSGKGLMGTRGDG